MIRINLYQDQNGMFQAFSVEGHAQHAPHGQDIICAGVSALVQGILIGLEDVVQASLEVEKQGGRLICSVVQGHGQRDVQILLETLYLSLEDLEKQYSEYIEVRKEEVEEHEN